MSGAIRVTTSFGGIDAETGASFDHGSHGEVQALATSGNGRITEEVFDDNYGDHVSQATVTRHGSSVAINSIEDYRDDDLIRLNDESGNGLGMEMTVGQLKAAGLGYMLSDAVNASVKSRQVGNTQAFDDGGDDGDGGNDTPSNDPSEYSHTEILAENLSEAVRAGEISDRTAAATQLFSDTAQMMGLDPDVATSYAMDAIDTGDFSLIAAQQGIDVEAAKSSISAVYDAVSSEAEKALGQIGMLELERAAHYHPEVRGAILQVGHAVATGSMGRSAFSDLLSQIKANYRV